MSIRYVISKGFSKIWLEEDSMNIINNLCGTHPLSWNVDQLIKDMVIMLQSCEETRVSHIYQEGKSLGDYFSNFVVCLSDFRL